MPTSYSPIPPAVNALLANAPQPHPLPPDLLQYYRALMNLTRETGYVFAGVNYLIDAWQRRSHTVYRIINKLIGFGWFVRYRVPGTRHYFLYPTRPRYHQQNAPEAPPAAQDSPEKQALVRLAVERGIQPAQARAIIAPHDPATIRPHVLAWCQWAKKNTVRDPARSLQKAIKEQWQPQERTEAQPRATYTPTPSPPNALDHLKNLDENLRGIFQRQKERAAQHSVGENASP